MSNPFDQFECHELPGGCRFFSGRLPPELALTEVEFTDLWDLHPPRPGTIKRFGRVTPVKRYQQAYGADYPISGCENRALPLPALLRPLLDWAKVRVDPRLNGLFVNWYDGSLGHQIGPHSDEDKDLVKGSPIVMISFGSERVFRLSRSTAGAKHRRDFRAASGTVFVLPYETNTCWKHAVPHLAGSAGKRISVTARAFQRGLLLDPPPQ
jgi:alkylated DNA repair dioxygenase AlkB